MVLATFRKSFNLTCHKEVMPCTAYTYENVSMGACSIQSALYVLQTEDHTHVLEIL